MSNLILTTAAAAAQPSGPAGLFGSFIIPMAMVLVIFWLLLWRPQARQMKEHRASIAAVKKGDEVVTAGGIRGKVTKVTDDEAEVEIAQGVRVRVVKSTLSQVLTKNAKPAND